MTRSFGGQVYQNGKLVPRILHVEDGLITKVATTTKADDHTDFGKAAILPGAIDIHVHFRDPGMTHKEDWTSGSISAAFGGVTGVVDMPNTAPPTTTLKALEDKLAIADAKSVIDYGAWAGASWYLGDLPAMLNLAMGVKIYMGATTGDLLMDDLERVQSVLDAAGKAGRPVTVHAEAQRVLEQFRSTESRLEDHDAFRPPVAEVEAIYDLMKMLPNLRKPPRVHIAHIASAEAVLAAKAAGFSRGVCPHHMVLDIIGCCEAMPTYGKMNPPLRTPTSKDALWQAFTAGDIPIIESDHAPHTAAEKKENFHQAPAGIPGVETMVPLLLTRDVPLATVVDAASKAPAELLGLEDRGTLAKGKRADFMVVHLNKPRPIEAASLHTQCRWTPFEEMPAVFPSDVICGGKDVVRDNELIAEPGQGEPLRGK